MKSARRMCLIEVNIRKKEIVEISAINTEKSPPGRMPPIALMRQKPFSERHRQTNEEGQPSRLQRQRGDGLWPDSEKVF